MSFQLTPMIDMTFLLLILSMVTETTEQELRASADLTAHRPPPRRRKRPSATSSTSTARATYFIGDRAASKTRSLPTSATVPLFSPAGTLTCALIIRPPREI